MELLPAHPVVLMVLMVCTVRTVQEDIVAHTLEEERDNIPAHEVLMEFYILEEAVVVLLVAVPEEAVTDSASTQQRAMTSEKMV